MEKIKKEIKLNHKNLAKRSSFMFIIIAISFIYDALNKITGNETEMITVVDKYIPFCKYFIVPYVLWYPYIGVFLILLCFLDKENYYKALIALITGMLISYFIFYIFPTAVVRPNITGSDVFTNLVLFVYNNDNPCNCFPSVHVLNSTLMLLYINKSSSFNRITKLISSIIAILIILSTVFVKQHVILDVAGGISLALLLYFLLNLFKLKISE